MEKEQKADAGAQRLPLQEKADAEAQHLPLQEKADAEAQRLPLQEKADELFAVYPDAPGFYFTADGTAFFAENDAKNHARGLKDKEIVKIVRDASTGKDNI